MAKKTKGCLGLKQKGNAASIRSATAARSTRLLVITVAAALLPLVGLLILRSLGLMLGQGALYYRFSTLDGVKTFLAAPCLLLAGLAIFAVHNFTAKGLQSRLATASAIAPLCLAPVWVWLAPPLQISQHTLNFRSPSQDGAFYLEATQYPPLVEYLHQFDQHLQRSVSEMLGTRVLSNPPGMTILSHIVNAVWPVQMNPPGRIEQFLLDYGTPAEDMTVACDTLALSIVLTVLWALSGLAAYFAGRTFLPATGAFAFAVVTTFTPSAVHFSPGKDPAQLLTINLMLCCWLRAYQRDSAMLAIAAGVCLAVGGVFGLIHFWVAAALFAATLWQGGPGKTIFRLALPALAGVALIVVGVDLACGWNIAKSWLAVMHRFNQVQGTFEIHRGIYFVIGLPLFSLFLPSGTITFAALAWRRRRLTFGAKLAITTLATMLVTYLLGVTYELPRLWIAFLPPLTLGLMMAVPLAHGTHRKTRAALALIITVQIISTAWHWTLLDVRESEYRLKNQRFFE